MTVAANAVRDSLLRASSRIEFSEGRQEWVSDALAALDVLNGVVEAAAAYASGGRAKDANRRWLDLKDSLAALRITEETLTWVGVTEEPRIR